MIRRDRADRKGGGCVLHVTNQLTLVHLRHFALPKRWSDLDKNTNQIKFSDTRGFLRPSWRHQVFRRGNGIEKAWRKFKNLVLVVDFNVDYSGKETELERETGLKEKLRSCLAQFNCVVVNNEPTRVTQRTATTIDLIIKNKPQSVKMNTTIDTGISDHKLMHSSLDLRPKKSNRQNEQFRWDLQILPDQRVTYLTTLTISIRRGKISSWRYATGTHQSETSNCAAKHFHGWQEY